MMESDLDTVQITLPQSSVNKKTVSRVFPESGLKQVFMSLEIQTNAQTITSDAHA